MHSGPQAPKGCYPHGHFFPVTHPWLLPTTPPGSAAADTSAQGRRGGGREGAGWCSARGKAEEGERTRGCGPSAGLWPACPLLPESSRQREGPGLQPPGSQAQNRATLGLRAGDTGHRAGPWRPNVGVFLVLFAFCDSFFSFIFPTFYSENLQI